MKKSLLLSAACLLTMVSLAFSAGETLSFNDNVGTATAGTYSSTATFSLDVTASWTGYTAIGLSYWIQVPTALAPFITITGETYFTWTDDNQTFFGSDQFTDTSGANSGNLTEPRDLGATSIFAGNPQMFQQVAAEGSYKVSTLNFSLSGAPAGTYTLMTTSVSPKISQITEGTSSAQTGSHPVLTQAVYTITVVPEPATWSLLGLGGIGSLGLTWLRARRRA